jgi:ADP-ribose pyrophosphatase YjhB (NUDIX family)
MPTLGVFAAIFDSERRILCVRMNYGTRGWTTPGGRVESGESAGNALVRETLEETGLVVSVGRLIGVYAKPQDDDVVLSFRARVLTATAWRPNDEIGELGYFAPDHLPQPMSLAARVRIADAVAGRRGVYRVVLPAQDGA